jgi:hypothetical protein
MSSLPIEEHHGRFEVFTAFTPFFIVTALKSYKDSISWFRKMMNYQQLLWIVCIVA